MAKIQEDIDPQFVDEEEAEPEFVDEEDVEKDPDSELPDDVKKASKKDLYDRVKAAEKKAETAPDPTERISKAFETAIDRIKPAETTQIAPAPGESDLQFKERLKRDLFDEDKAEDVLNEAIDRRLGPRFAQTVELNFRQAEKIMELDPETGPVFKRYKVEINTYIKANFPPALHRNPQALEYAYKQVMAGHIEDIAQERANAILEVERKKSVETTRRVPIPLESGGGSGGTSEAPRRKIITVTQEDRRIADERGVDASVIAAQRSARMS
jgi:hypothetical protein